MDIKLGKFKKTKYNYSKLGRITFIRGSVSYTHLELESVEHKLADVKRTLAERADKAKRAEQQKNDLVVYLAHDIKTPLTSVIGYLSLLDETPDMPDEEKAKYIHTAWEKANRLRTCLLYTSRCV